MFVHVRLFTYVCVDAACRRYCVPADCTGSAQGRLYAGTFTYVISHTSNIKRNTEPEGMAGRRGRLKEGGGRDGVWEWCIMAVVVMIFK